MVEYLPAQPNIKYESTDIGFAGPNQRTFRLAYQAYSPVTAPRKLKDIGLWSEESGRIIAFRDMHEFERRVLKNTCINKNT